MGVEEKSNANDGAWKLIGYLIGGILIGWAYQLLFVDILFQLSVERAPDDQARETATNVVRTLVVVAFASWGLAGLPRKKLVATGVIGITIPAIILAVVFVPPTHAVVAAKHSDLGHELLIAGRNEDALIEFDQALTHNPTLPEALNGRIMSLDALGRGTEAIRDVDVLIQTDPGNSGAWLARCSLRTAINALDAALGDCNRAVELDPTSIGARVQRAAVLLLHGRESEAAKDAAFAGMDIELLRALIDDLEF